MAKVFTRKYPQLRVHIGDTSVKFKDGEAVVSGDVASALLALDGFGIEVADEPDAEPEVADGAGGTEADTADEPDAEPEARKPGRPKKS